MKVSIMQPNIFMWCGLLKALIDSDLHIIRDEVKSTKNSRYNRNLIGSDDSTSWMTIPFVGFKDSKIIREQKLSTSKKTVKKLKSLFYNKYKNYPYFTNAEKILEKTLTFESEETGLCEVYSSFLDGLREFGLPICKTIFASNLENNSQSKNLSGVNKVNFLLQETKADTYFTAQNTINYALPSEYNVQKVFVQKFEAIPYKQNPKRNDLNNFLPNLSCMDIISCLSKEEILENLEKSNLWRIL